MFGILKTIVKKIDYVHSAVTDSQVLAGHRRDCLARIEILVRENRDMLSRIRSDLYEKRVVKCHHPHCKRDDQASSGWGFTIDGGPVYITITHCPHCGEKLKA